MSIQIQLRRGSTASHASFTGAVAEPTYDTDAKSIRIHDGATAGGWLLATQAWVTSQLVSGVADGTLTPAKFANTSQNTILGRVLSGAGAPAWLNQSETQTAIGMTSIGSGVAMAASAAAAALALGFPTLPLLAWMHAR
jgi:hypothetical protein